jgi:hypothetical protein
MNAKLRVKSLNYFKYLKITRKNIGKNNKNYNILKRSGIG